MADYSEDDEWAIDPEHSEVSTADADGLDLDPDSVALTEREIQAVELRKAGYTFHEIAQAVGLEHRSSAMKMVRRALNRWGVERVDELRLLELSRLDTITRRLWPQVLGRPEQRDDAGNVIREATPPSQDAIRTYLRISERRAKLLGLDSPEEIMIGLQGRTDEVPVVQDYEAFVTLLDTVVEQRAAEAAGSGGPAHDHPVLPAPSDDKAD